MRRPLAATCTAFLAAALVLMGTGAAQADEGTASGGSITIPGGDDSSGPSDPYPSVGTMSGVPGTISSASLTLTGFSHSYPGDLQILIQAPSGKSVLVSGYCGSGFDVENIDLTFVDGAAAAPGWLSDTGFVTGSYAPTDCGEYVDDDLEPSPSPTGLPSPAPDLPYEAAFASLTGEDPNGEWKLWINDGAGGDDGDLVSWTLTVATTVAAAAPTLPDTGFESTTIALSALALLGAGGIVLYTRRRYGV